MKNLLIATASMFLLSQKAEAQREETKKISVSWNKEFTPSGMFFNVGDTAYLEASGTISINPEITEKLGKTGPCGYATPQNLSFLDQLKYDTYINQYNRTDHRGNLLPHHGALIVYNVNNKNITAAAELCSLETDPKNKARKRLIFRAASGELTFNLNDKSPSKNTGSIDVTIEAHRKKKASNSL
ncbi:MAG: hypothetical protein JWM96_401 [Alphaproteobacteria bacterium]|nr:hypothetical protein [Alphaproteobacteria bacterium]